MDINNMRINNTSIQGLFLYVDGITYEKDDLIYYKGNLYSVISGSYVGMSDNTPDVSRSCKLYIDLLEDEGTIITTQNLTTLLHSTFGGIELGGIVSRVNIESITDLDLFTSTGVYAFRCDFKIGDESAKFDALLRVYKLENKIIQEIINYDSKSDSVKSPWSLANIYYRTFTDSWSEFSHIVSCGSDFNAFKEELGTYHRLNKELIDKVKHIDSIQSTAHYAALNEIEGNMYLDDFKDILLTILYSYTKNNMMYQTSATIDPNLGPTTYHVTGTDGTELNVTLTEEQAGGYHQYKVSAVSSLPDFRVCKMIKLTR